jgi:hypothetical protein
MRFGATVIQNLKNGDSKVVFRFALLPKRIGDGWLWFERYKTLYAWIETVYKLQIEGKEMQFTHGEWQIVSQQPIKIK